MRKIAIPLIVLFALPVCWLVPGAEVSSAPDVQDYGKRKKAAAVPVASIRVQRVLYKTRVHMKAKEYDKCLAIIEEFLHAHPDQDHYLLEFTMGNAHYPAGSFQESLACFEKAVTLGPGYGPAWLNLGKTAYELNKYGLAADALTRGFALSEDKDANILYYAAVAHIMDNQPAKAIPLLEELLSGQVGSPQKDWFRALLSVYMDLDQSQDARKLMARMLGLYPEDPEVWKLCYQFEAHQGDYRMAVVAMTIYSYFQPLSREESILLADLLSTINVPLLASESYEKALTSDTSPEEFERLVSAYMAAHRPEAARKALNRALEEDPNARLWSLLGDLLYMEDDFQGAIVAFQHSAQLDPGKGRPYLMMGYCSLQLGRKGEAVPALKKAATFPEQQELAEQLLEQTARF